MLHAAGSPDQPRRRRSAVKARRHDRRIEVASLHDSTSPIRLGVGAGHGSAHHQPRWIHRAGGADSYMTLNGKRTWLPTSCCRLRKSLDAHHRTPRSARLVTKRSGFPLALDWFSRGESLKEGRCSIRGPGIACTHTPSSRSVGSVRIPSPSVDAEGITQ